MVARAGYRRTDRLTTEIGPDGTLPEMTTTNAVAQHETQEVGIDCSEVSQSVGLHPGKRNSRSRCWISDHHLKATAPGSESPDPFGRTRLTRQRD